MNNSWTIILYYIILYNIIYYSIIFYTILYFPGRYTILFYTILSCLFTCMQWRWVGGPEVPTRRASTPSREVGGRLSIVIRIASIFCFIIIVVVVVVVVVVVMLLLLLVVVVVVVVVVIMIMMLLLLLLLLLNGRPPQPTPAASPRARSVSEIWYLFGLLLCAMLLIFDMWYLIFARADICSVCFNVLISRIAFSSSLSIQSNIYI